MGRAANVVDEAAVVERWGVYPWRVVDLFALAGDAGDCVPGVHGWGPKRRRPFEGGRTSNDSRVVKPGGHWWVPENGATSSSRDIDAIKSSYDLVRLRGDGYLGRSGFRCTS